MVRMEPPYKAFTTRDKKVLEEVLIRNPRTKSYDQVVKVIDKIPLLPFNEEMKKTLSWVKRYL